MDKEQAFEIKKLWEEIVILEGFAKDDDFNSLEYLARRLNEATAFNYPNTASQLHGIENKARAYIQNELAALTKELTEKLDKL